MTMNREEKLLHQIKLTLIEYKNGLSIDITTTQLLNCFRDYILEPLPQSTIETLKSLNEQLEINKDEIYPMSLLKHEQRALINLLEIIGGVVGE